MPQLPEQAQHRFYWIIIFVSLYSILPFLILSFYNHPSVDDFEYAVRDNQNSFLATQTETYYNWSGRYFATAISRINPIRFESLTGYKVCSFLLLAAFILTLYLFISTLFKEFTSKQKVALTGFIVIVYISQMPDITRGLFYMTAYLVYQLPNILTFVLLLLLIKLFSLKEKAARIMYTTVLVLVSAAIIGSNEVSLVYLITSFAFMLLMLRQYQHQLFKYILVVFACCLAAGFIMVLAPGNYVRMSLQTHDSGNITWSVLASVVLIFTYFYKWGILLTLASILYIFLWQRIPAFAPGAENIFKVPLRLSLLYFVITLFLMNFAFTWSVGAVPKSSVENVIYFYFVLGWFYNLQVAINRFYGHFYRIRSTSILTAALLFLFIRLVLDINNNINTAYLDLLSGKATKYNKELNMRYTFLKTSGCNLCMVEPLSSYPKSLYAHDVTHNLEEKERLVNSAPRKYWGKEGIYLTVPNPKVDESNLETVYTIGRRIKHKLLRPRQ